MVVEGIEIAQLFVQIHVEVPLTTLKPGTGLKTSLWV
jgi:hypothetical protein